MLILFVVGVIVDNWCDIFTHIIQWHSYRCPDVCGIMILHTSCSSFLKLAVPPVTPYGPIDLVTWDDDKKINEEINVRNICTKPTSCYITKMYMNTATSLFLFTCALMLNIRTFRWLIFSMYQTYMYSQLQSIAITILIGLGSMNVSCPRDNSGPDQAMIAKFGQRVPIVLEGNWHWPSRSN